MAIRRLTHIGICVSNLDRSLHFYEKVLGFHRISSLDASGEMASRLLEIDRVELNAVYLERDGTTIELLHYAKPGHRGEPAPRPMNQLGLTHLSLQVSDLAGTLREIEAAGVTTLMEQTRLALPDGNVAAIFLTDPDGTRIELVQD